jgi:hypothetical protein
MTIENQAFMVLSKDWLKNGKKSLLKRPKYAGKNAVSTEFLGKNYFV